MISWLSNWAEQLIVAVVIVTIIEMILPDNKNKKYVKVIMGFYILFIIISPFISKFTNTDLNNINFNYEEYFKESNTYQSMSKKLDTSNNENIEEVYKTGLKEDITSKLLQRGYIVNSIQIEVNSSSNNDYGKINKITMNIAKKKENTEEEKNNKNNISINSVEKVIIGNVISSVISSSNKSDDKKTEISSSDKYKIKEYLSDTYEINQKNIIIN